MIVLTGENTASVQALTHNAWFSFCARYWVVYRVHFYAI